MVSKNINLNKARGRKNDEFYTKLSTIEDELQWYSLKGKVVYCNCDDYRESNFYKYFKDNFHKLGIKALYASNLDIGNKAFIAHYDGVVEVVEEVVVGGFDSESSILILNICDVVVTNPPFSLFRDFVDLLVEHNKDFIILGSLNAVTYKNVFPLIKGEFIKFGTKQGSIEYSTPDGSKTLGNTMWFTTLSHSKAIDIKIPTKNLLLDSFKTYDGTDVINVDKWVDTPMYHDKVMGVPISSIDKVGFSGFDIVGAANNKICLGDISFNTFIEGKPKYMRLFIKKKGV